MTFRPRQHTWRHRAAIGSALSLAVITTACSGGTGEDIAPAFDKRELASTSEPAKGEVDTVTWNLTTGEPDTIDPPNAVTYGGGQVVMNLCDTLMRYDADYNLSPGLVDYDQVTPTQLIYTVREGATFWNGDAVTAEDVAFSLNRAKQNSIVSIFFSAVDSIEVTGPDEVTVEFDSPDEKFNTEMANVSGAVVEKSFAEQAGKNFGTAAGGLMCSGPFKLDDWKSGESILISRNDDYWDASLRPLAKQVRFTFVTDTPVLVQALEAGEIDGAYELPPSAIQALAKSDTGRLYYGPSTQSVSLFAVNPEGIAGDPTFMNGLQHIIDRDGLVQAIYHGAGEPLYTNLTPRTWPTEQEELYRSAYTPFEKSRGLDVEAAKELVENSGYTGEDIVLAYQAGDATQSQISQLVQQQAKLAGINIKLQSMGALAFQQAGYDASKRRGIDLMFGSSFNTVADPLELAMFSLLPDSPYNYTGYDDAKTVAMLNEAVQTFDADARAKIVIAAQERWEAANLTVPLASTYTTTFLNDRLAGAVTSFAYWSMPNMAGVGSSS